MLPMSARPMHYSPYFNDIGSLPSKTMDIRKLRHVALLADTLHFARAAESAHLTQSALSRSILSLVKSGIRDCEWVPHQGAG